MNTVAAFCVQGVLLLAWISAAPASAGARIDPPHALSSEPFDLRLQANPPDARIVYTLDGSAPSTRNGSACNGLIRITGTTVGGANRSGA